MSRKPDPTFAPREAVCTGCGRDCMTVEVDKGWTSFIHGKPQHFADYRECSDCCGAEFIARMERTE